MSASVFLTGFPGFIAKRLITRLMDKDPELRFTFLIQEHMRGLAQASLQELRLQFPALAEPERAVLVAGDITLPLLGLDHDTYWREARRSTHVWHLAAVYDLGVKLDLAYRVNVIGTATVLDFCEACTELVRLDYVSTCYVSGLRKGRVLESELEEGQAFKNHYESTKCWAELEVRRRMYRMPVAITRPSVVVGDSRTGETDKYDGPYFYVGSVLSLPAWLPVPNVGDGDVPFNLVPVDFVVDAMAHLAFKPEAIGSTVQLADPSPHSVRSFVSATLDCLGRKEAPVDISSTLMQASLGLGKVRDMVKVPPETLAYFRHPVQYDTSNQQRLLEGSGVSCPDLLQILPTLINVMQQDQRSRRP